jgi:uncharacterized protein YacL
MDPAENKSLDGDPEKEPKAAEAQVFRAASAPAKPRLLRRLLSPGPMASDVHDRLAIFAVRACFFFVSAGLGIYGVRVLGQLTERQDLDVVLGILIACGTAALLIVLEIFFSKGPIRTLAAITFGLIIGLILSLVFQFVVEFIVMAVTSAEVQSSAGFSSLLSFLRVLTTTILCYFGVTVLLQTKDDFKFIIPYVEFRREVKAHTPLILDTSCFVDGRIQSLLATGIFDQRLVVPKFVLTELQLIADSADRSLRERGRRGMDILHELDSVHLLELTDDTLRDGEDVDSALIKIAPALEGKIVTTDYNLQKNARLQGIPVLNINDLATALKPAFVPGENMTVRLLREGDDKGQAVGFLKDGTMVVVENARQRIGQEVEIEVTSSLQTSAGKMVFGRLRKAARAANEP